MVFHRILDFKKGPISIGLCVFQSIKTMSGAYSSVNFFARGYSPNKFYFHPLY